jgi:hypothetical protein
MNLVEVTREQFFAIVNPMNVHPRSEKEASYWEMPDRRLIGKTTPGYMCKGHQAYFINTDEVKL